MSLQTSIRENIGEGFAGTWYDISDQEAVSKTVEGSAAPFGIAMLYGTNNNQCRVPDNGDELGLGATTDADNRFAGVSMYHAVAPRAVGAALAAPLGDGDTAFLAERETASLSREGRIRVLCTTAVRKGDPVYYVHTVADASTEFLGRFTNTAGANVRQVPGASFLYDQPEPGIAIVDFSQPPQV